MSNCGACDLGLEHTHAVSGSAVSGGRAEGCWVAYGLDHSEHWSTAVFDDELAAHRYAAKGYLHVGFLRWGQPLDTVEER